MKLNVINITVTILSKQYYDELKNTNLRVIEYPPAYDLLNFSLTFWIAIKTQVS